MDLADYDAIKTQIVEEVFDSINFPELKSQELIPYTSLVNYK